MILKLDAQKINQEDYFAVSVECMRTSLRAQLVLPNPEVLIVVEELLQERVEAEFLKLLGDHRLWEDVDLALFALRLDKYLFIARLLHPHLVGFRILWSLL
jgi:hypothetical protein